MHGVDSGNPFALQANPFAGSLAYSILHGYFLVNSFSDSFLKELSLLFKKNYLPSLGEIQLLCGLRVGVIM